MPKRIQRRRTKGFRLPEGCVYVGRGSKWGNPFKIGIDGDAATCVRLYAESLTPYQHHGETSTLTHLFISMANIDAIKAELAGRDLACWCEIGQPCHADWLLEIANAG